MNKFMLDAEVEQKEKKKSLEKNIESLQNL